MKLACVKMKKYKKNFQMINDKGLKEIPVIQREIIRVNGIFVI